MTSKDCVSKPHRITVTTDDEVYHPKVLFIPAQPSTTQPTIQPPTAQPLTPQLSPEPHKHRPRRRVRSILGTVLVSAVAIIAVALIGLRIAGFHAFTVMSGSMAKEYPVGSLIYVRPVNYQELAVGDVISYVANSDNTVVTHRITAIEVDPANPDVWRFQTKGDENDTPDANLVHYKNVLGTPIITLPYIGYLSYSVQRPPGIYITLVVGTLLLAWTFLPKTLEERRKTAKRV